MLEGKQILITGSSSGIGAATAELAKEYGAKVILHDRDDNEHLRHLADRLDAKYIVCNVAEKNSVKISVDELLDEIRHLDALINCAGIVKPIDFLKTEDWDWQNMFNIDLLGTVHFCQAVIPSMQKRKKGRIVNIASLRGHPATSSFRDMPYSVAKAGIITLTSALAKNFAPDIAVNAVSPGFVDTPISKTWNRDVWKQVETSLVQRVAKPKEIAEVLLFLASDRASYITGQTIIADGGHTIAHK